ncbi:MAG: prepilin-type N-terminal cleavage/methylation domain-containing protein [bacterium]|nr:prepilin-type N-terminal cleavage/methylation domain-containing protein [bacterium]
MRRGFSLIELLIAAVLLAIIGLMLTTTLNSSIEVKERVDGISNRYFFVRQALSRMSREISMAYLSEHKNFNSPVVITQFKGEKSALAFAAFGGFVRQKNAQESDQREISYFMQKDKDNISSLMRKEKINLTNDLGKSGKTYVLCPNVKSVEFKYWNQSTKKWQNEWSTEGVAAQKILPSRVQIEMIAILENNQEEKFITETEIWITTPIKILE